MRVLLTGGAGFIGSHLTDALLEAGHEVAILDDLSTGKRANLAARARFHEVDIRNAAAVEAAFAEFRPDVVSHQAAQTSVAVSTREPILDAESNIIGMIHVLQACVRHRVQRVVFASSGGTIYGEVEGERKAAVGDSTHPLSPYGASKLAGEHYLYTFRHEHGLPFTALRYGNVYGPRQDPHGEAGVVAIFSRRLLEGQPIRVNARRTVGDPGCIRDYVYVADVVRANVAALEGRLGIDTINVCTGRPTTTLEIAQGLQKALGIEAQIDFGPRRPGDLERSVLDAGPLERELGPTVDLETGLARTVGWFREHG